VLVVDDSVVSGVVSGVVGVVSGVVSGVVVDIDGVSRNRSHVFLSMEYMSTYIYTCTHTSLCLFINTSFNNNMHPHILYYIYLIIIFVLRIILIIIMLNVRGHISKCIELGDSWILLYTHT
jgi:hypothetical protein